MSGLPEFRDVIIYIPGIGKSKNIQFPGFFDSKCPAMDTLFPIRCLECFSQEACKTSHRKLGKLPTKSLECIPQKKNFESFLKIKHETLPQFSLDNLSQGFYKASRKKVGMLATRNSESFVEEARKAFLMKLGKLSLRSLESLLKKLRKLT